MREDQIPRVNNPPTVPNPQMTSMGTIRLMTPHPSPGIPLLRQPNLATLTVLLFAQLLPPELSLFPSANEVEQ